MPAVLDVPEVMRCVRRVSSVCRRCCEVLDVPEVIRCVLLCMLEAVEGELCLLEVLEVLEMTEVMRCVLF